MSLIKIDDVILQYEINSGFIEIIELRAKSKELERKLINKLIVCTNHLDLNIRMNQLVIKKDDYRIKRFFKIGSLKTGKKNNICDCEGVSVGHFTLNNGDYHTGITVIKPHPGNIFKEKVVASSYSFNGFGKSIGLVQVEELGTIETNVVFTSTMQVGKIADGVVEEALENNPEIAETTGTVNPLVMECNDGDLNKSRDRILTKDDYKKALNNVGFDFVQGDVGAGSGMTCHGFKGGIGSSSRVVNIDGKDYTIGVIVNSNFGSSNGEDLIINACKFTDLCSRCEELLMDEKGSIVACVATNAPLNERQLKRILKRVEIGIGRTGSFAGNGSGDVFVGFSTANKRFHFNEKAISYVEFLSDSNINPLFKGVVEATEEAVLNSMMFAHHLKGYKKELKALGEESNLLIDLFDEEIEWKD